MKWTIAVPDSLAEAIERFCLAEGIALDQGSDEQVTLSIAASDDRRECDLFHLYVGGSIPCETARTLAHKLGIEILAVGRLLNLLDIRVRHCGLGCF